MVPLDKVARIEAVGFGDFYDLQVPDVHHYFAEGAIHHNSGKTHEGSWTALTLWLANPTETCVLVSSTDIRGLRMRVWGELTSLWQKAIERFDFLPGHILDSKLAITAESLTDEDGDFNDRLVRNFRSAIIGIPTVQNGKHVGLSKWIGIKQKNVVLVADEAQFMGPSFLSAFANLNKNENFRAIVLGNPNDILDPLGKAAEPVDGWDGHMMPEKTESWKTRFMNGICVNLIGTDSPNFDFPAEEPPRFKYLISKKKIDDTIAFFGKDSFEFMSQCYGAMRIGTLARRVLTRRICDEGNVLETDVTWMDGNRIRVYFLDAAYGGDRCVAGWGEFGRCVDGKIRLLLHEPSIIPILVRTEKEPEQQIAEYVRKDCEGLNIAPENMGHDATGRGSLGTFLARVWSAMTNPIESGGPPTDRPVSLDVFRIEIKNGQPTKRLTLCKEHYVKRVTEYWFSVRYAVQADQLRGMTQETSEEFCQREWDRVKDDKIELETKIDMKDRIGRSPDLADWAAGVLEMARRRGFQISKLANEPERQESALSALEELSRQRAKMERSKELNYAL